MYVVLNLPMRKEWVLHGEKSLDGHGQCAVDTAHEANVSQGKEVGQHVDPVDSVVFRVELGQGEQEDGTHPVSYTHLTLPTIYSV